jgi:hypothetical protein
MFVYYVNGQRFETDNFGKIPWFDISSPNENTPALEDLSDGYKEWCLKGRIRHRLIGPSVLYSNGNYDFFLNENYYETVNEWIKAHPNPDLYFDAIGVYTETDKILWYLQN